MQKVITHNGGFHTDDVFAVATLGLALGPENIEVVRTRDEAVIAAGDIVVDVGGAYDPALQRFDHHQLGAPVRENGIPYAAFGLVWKHYGEQVAGSKEVADIIEQKLVLPIDASDNGVQTFEQKLEDISPVTVQDVVGLWKPAWKGEEDVDGRFLEAVAFARDVLKRAVMHTKADMEERQAAETLYESSDNKRVLISDAELSPSLFIDHPEVLFVVFADENGNWDAVAVRERHDSFATRVRFPEEWGGLRDAELATASGIPDAVFCHRAGFIFVAKSKEGVLAAVQKALA